MTTTTAAADVCFADADLFAALDSLGDDALDTLDFGVIGFDADGVVRRYNAFESKAAGLSPARVLGQPLFTVVAPCMNNFMVAQRFDEARETATALDVTVDYVLTLRMRPVKVKLRLLAAAEPAHAAATPGRYVLVQRTV
jgi:photoactive yellow protein